MSKYEVIIFHEGVPQPLPLDDNWDVEVRFENGKRYAATFFTIESIEMLMKRYAATGECLSGLYFWSINMIIVRDTSRETIEKVIDDLIREKEFEASFLRLED